MTTINQIKKLNKAKGGEFFSPNSMRFFDSKVLNDVVHCRGKAYFVTSEQFHPSQEGRQLGFADADRKYTVRQINLTSGAVDTVGEHGEYKTAEAAKKAMHRKCD
jgi:hypothetical protein